MGCTSSACTLDDVSPIPPNQPHSDPKKRPSQSRSRGCGSLFCLSGAGVDVPEQRRPSAPRVKKINVKSTGTNSSIAPSTPRAHGRVFEICDATKSKCNRRVKPPRPLPKILEEDRDTEVQRISTTKVEKFSEEDAHLPGSTVPKLPPLFTPRPLPPTLEDTKATEVLNQSSWDELLTVENNHGDTRNWELPPRPHSRTEITRDVVTSRPRPSPRRPKKMHKTRVLWETSYDTTGRLSNICDIAFLRSDCLAVSQDSDNKSGLQLYDLPNAGLPGQVIGDPEISLPRGVCLDREGHVVVTDAHSKTVKFMDTNGNYLASWKHGKFGLPAGIAQTKEGQFIVSDERGGDKAIGLYSGRGTVVRKFGMPWFDCPWYVAVDNYNRILVSEQSVSGVIVFDNHGRFLFKFGSYGRGEGQLNFQSGIAIDSQNQILVADSDNYRICLYSPDGYFIENVVTHLPSRPVSVALYEPQSLLAIATDDAIFMHQMNNGINSPHF